MNKNTLRTLALGFLSSAILTGLYATFVQGNVPVRGVSVNSVLNSQSNTNELTSQYESDLASLKEENQSLMSLNEDYAKSMTELESAQNESIQRTETAMIASENESTSTEDETNTLDESSSTVDEEDSMTSEIHEDPSLDVDPNSIVDFTISPGDTSTDIAYRLEEAGIISSAQELQDLFEYWDLETVLQDGTYELHPGMSIHEVAEVLTHYTYYYYE
ncbi:endolytic transglycosylase MltG [Dolosicoccus paucivorans]|uniref:Endolytic transglycosylase MltG n=1 Tax=Dolosicoccus paucivorans TaxID=84521 RepID=A0A1G8JLH8_9LACT|nr:endolytic transglycosylase MltG [Dolosicoccus paucivorans]PMB84309.1 hypothetical protein CJ206_04435 [Dolosicoccus paucivorans]PMC58482.1 hypothetical protein CJ205_04255 [Dolosicoccus paucivorans]SDI32002.1 YceG-like family protein [Dolosicoccus paucivorans]